MIYLTNKTAIRGHLACEGHYVIVVLERNGVEVSGQDESPTDMLILSKGSRIKGQQLPEIIGLKMVRYLARIFDIPLTQFYDLKTSSSDQPV